MRDIKSYERVEKALDMLHGERETFRSSLEPEAIIKRICRTAEITARQEGVPAWTIIGNITGH